MNKKLYIKVFAFKWAAVLLALFFAVSAAPCLAQDTQEYVVIGTAPADLYSQPGFEPPIGRIPAGSKLPILDKEGEAAMPGPITWFKVSYNGKEGWVSQQASLEYEKQQQVMAEEEKRNTAKVQAVSKITTETSESQIIEWFGNPPKTEERAGSIKVFEYDLSKGAGGCWTKYKLLVQIDIKSGKVIAHEMKEMGAVCI